MKHVGLPLMEVKQDVRLHLGASSGSHPFHSSGCSLCLLLSAEGKKKDAKIESHFGKNIKNKISV